MATINKIIFFFLVYSLGTLSFSTSLPAWAGDDWDSKTSSRSLDFVRHLVWTKYSDDGTSTEIRIRVSPHQNKKFTLTITSEDFDPEILSTQFQSAFPKATGYSFDAKKKTVHLSSEFTQHRQDLYEALEIFRGTYSIPTHIYNQLLTEIERLPKYENPSRIQTLLLMILGPKKRLVYFMPDLPEYTEEEIKTWVIDRFKTWDPEEIVEIFLKRYEKDPIMKRRIAADIADAIVRYYSKESLNSPILQLASMLREFAADQKIDIDLAVRSKILLAQRYFAELEYEGKSRDIRPEGKEAGTQRALRYLSDAEDLIQEAQKDPKILLHPRRGKKLLSEITAAKEQLEEKIRVFKGEISAPHL